LMPPNMRLPDKPIIRDAPETPPKPPVVEEIISTSEEPEATPEVAEVADTKKA